MTETLCTLCPRNCKADRKNNQKGVCMVAGEKILVSRAALHFFEEPCISGEKGSGTVFFSGCNLHCVYCQNEMISGGKIGEEISTKRLSEIFIELQKKGAENINLVTPTHYSDDIILAIQLARENGLQIPIVYNCSGYEKVETLKKLSGYIDIYLTDYKYSESALAKELSHAEDYPEVAMEALKEMVSQKPSCVFDKRGMMKSGVIVRNLLLPGHRKNSEGVVKAVYENFGDNVFLSLMSQYTPMKNFENYPFLNRKVTKREYNRFIEYTLSLGVSNAFIQEGETVGKSFIPDFNLEGVK